MEPGGDPEGGGAEFYAHYVDAGAGAGSGGGQQTDAGATDASAGDPVEQQRAYYAQYIVSSAYSLAGSADRSSFAAAMASMPSALVVSASGDGYLPSVAAAIYSAASCRAFVAELRASAEHVRELERRVRELDSLAGSVVPVPTSPTAAPTFMLPAMPDGAPAAPAAPASAFGGYGAHRMSRGEEEDPTLRQYVAAVAAAIDAMAVAQRHLDAAAAYAPGAAHAEPRLAQAGGLVAQRLHEGRCGPAAGPCAHWGGRRGGAGGAGAGAGWGRGGGGTGGCGTGCRGARGGHHHTVDSGRRHHTVDPP